MVGSYTRTLISLAALSLASMTHSATFTVTSTADTGPGTLRQAIADANAAAGSDEIVFAIPGTGPHVIQLAGSLPNVQGELTLDGSTQPGGDCAAWPPTLNVSIDAAQSADFGLLIQGDDVTIRGISVHSAPLEGIRVVLSDRFTLTCSFVGTDATGTQGIGNGRVGLTIIDGDDHVIGESNGSVGNIIAASALEGMFLFSTTNALIVGNRIGSDITGNAALGNTIFGVNLRGTVGSTVQDNVVVGNGGAGVVLESNTANENVVIGNSIGIGADGITALPNVEFVGPTGGGPGSGIILNNAPGARIGGTASGEGNVIGANEGDGVLVFNDANDTVIQGNLIGTDATGLLPRGNGDSGIAIFTTGNVVGGLADGAGNVLADNGLQGISIQRTSSNDVVGNLIGVGADGITPLGNQNNGVFIQDAEDNLISDNVASANVRDGILLSDVSTQNTVRRNYVGTDRNGLLMLGNGADGIDTGSETSNNTIGGSELADGNVVAFNGDLGLEIEGQNNALLGNRVFGNVTAEIDIGNDGRNVNDPGDADAGANNLQNYPEFSSVVGDGDMLLTYSYLVDSDPANSTYPLRIEFYLADSGGNERRRLVGIDEYPLADAQSIRTAPISPLVAVLAGDVIVATATDADGNTSEFSDPISVMGSADPESIFRDGFEAQPPGR